jgi:hypothetical protein
MFVKHALSLKSEALKMFLNVSLEKHVFKSKKGAYLLRKKGGPNRPIMICLGWAYWA